MKGYDNVESKHNRLDGSPGNLPDLGRTGNDEVALGLEVDDLGCRLTVSRTYMTQHNIRVRIFRYWKQYQIFEGYIEGHRTEGSIYYSQRGIALRPKH